LLLIQSHLALHDDIGVFERYEVVCVKSAGDCHKVKVGGDRSPHPLVVSLMNRSPWSVYSTDNV